MSRFLIFNIKMALKSLNCVTFIKKSAYKRDKPLKNSAKTDKSDLHQSQRAEFHYL
jgi:hypothetical protein